MYAIMDRCKNCYYATQHRTFLLYCVVSVSVLYADL